MNPFPILQVAIICLFPAVAIYGAKRSKILDWLSPVALCYLAGIILANVKVLPVDIDISTSMTEATVLLAIPLLLFSTHFFGWLRMAKSTVISFSLSIAAVLIMTALGAAIFASKTDDAARIAAMLVGVYTGGTPNMNAIGIAVGASQETLLLVNAADLVIGAAYFFLLMTFAQRLLLLFLPAFKLPESKPGQPSIESISVESNGRPTVVQLVLAFLAAVAIAGLSVGISKLVFGKMAVGLIILTATTLGIVSSFFERVRRTQGTYELGQYLLLMFCVAIGSVANIDKIMTAGPTIFGYVALVMFGSIVLHTLFAAILRIDADTVIITSTAAIFGPAFVGPIAGVLKNRHLLVGGLTSGLIGIALGNYLGLALYWLVSQYAAG